MWPYLVELESSGPSGILTEWVSLMDFPLTALTVWPVFKKKNVLRRIFGKFECSGLWYQCLQWNHFLW